ncbi:MAG: DnaJ domain-containing protein [Polyangiaceae bacterium]
MQLPGRLSSTTLGDLLGALCRARATGTLELAEDRGRVHRIYLSQGRVAAVDLEGASPRLAEILRRDHVANDDVLTRSLLRAMASRRLHGEVLIDDFHLSPSLVGRALRQQVWDRLAVLDRLVDERVSFRVAVRPPRGALGTRQPPLDPHEFLHGRRRARERSAPQGASSRASSSAQTCDSNESGESAWHLLGVPPGAEVREIKRAYRTLARSVHPDLHPDATDDERRSLQARFAELTEAYRTLVA